MIYKKLGHTNLDISRISMGGHEYLPDGRSRGFNEDFDLATTTHHIFPGFGDQTRKKVLSLAFEHGLNFFDVTQDSEKEALGRNLKEIPPPYDIYIQTRPEGMAYTYDPYNAKMAQYDLLKAEVQRIVKLLQRERIDFLNIPFLRPALEHDPEYLDKIRYNLETLKQEGLIRFASADTFSGEYTYMRQIESGAFDAVYINFNFADHCPKNRVLPAAQEKGLGVISREAFMKGELFKMGDEVGVTDRTKLAQIAIKWNLSHEAVTTLIVGTNNPDHLVANLAVLDDLGLTDEEHGIIQKITTSSIYKAYEDRKTKEFLEQA
ncbi:aldo/keto reductase [candidate division KSB3 bacterium]|uniref:Aldo/keto reductase n=1 Tax=candidate division KSB3 bacterium TaxID=2044937 RepID=A0A9D5JV49_9BACT|nr:aldo/keto reductase [candidate division KSB3 bacterium]MBD3324842.1 aldo/keto reductase [candidate division KSB3 bacterium]